MRIPLRLLGLIVASLLQIVLAQIAPAAAQSSTIRVSEPFAITAGGRAAAAYMNIQGGPDQLLGASCDLAGQVELHETIREEGVTTMRPVRGMLISPGAATRLVPGGLHIMLLNLKRALKEGETIAVTLTFERAAKLTVQVPVGRTPAAQPGIAVPGLRR